MTTLLRQSGNLLRLSRSSLRRSTSTRVPYTSQLSYPASQRLRGYATVNPGDPKPPKNDKDGATKKKTVAGEGSNVPGKAASGFENLYNGNSPISPNSIDGATKAHDAAPQTAKLTEAEQKDLEGLLKTIKKGLPKGQTEQIEKAFRNIIRDGIPKEIREVMDQLKGGEPLDLATAAKLVRMTSTMARQTAERDMAKESEDAKAKASSTDAKAEPSGQNDKKQKAGSGADFKMPEVKIDTQTLLISAFVAYLLYRTMMPSDNGKEITWQEFRTTFLDKGLVDKLIVINRNRVRVDLHREATAQMYPESPAVHSNFHYYFSIGSVEAFERRVDEAQKELGIPGSERIPVAYSDEISWFSTVLSFGPTLLLIGFFVWMSRRAASGGAGGQSGIFGMGRSRAKKFNHETEVKVKFKDVAGMDEAKAEIMEFVSFLKEPGQYQRLGAKIPRGAILSGPPGTGKTLLAKATAGESSVPFFSVSGSEFVEMFVGVGSSRVRDLFANARKNTPCIIFIDEIDAIGKSRSKNNWGGGNDERESTLNQILTEMDGFNTSEQVVVLAGTNRPDVLDKALMRPGRFDRHIAIDRPTMQGRKEIFLVHLGKIVTSEDMDYLTSRLAALTPGFCGADIANCVNEAALIGKLSASYS